MKLGSESRTKFIIAIVLMCVAVFLLIRMLSGASAPEPASAPTATATATAGAPAQAASAPAPPPRTAQRRGTRRAPAAVLNDTLDPTLRLDLLKASEETKYEGKGRNIFRAQAEPAPELPKPVQPVMNRPTANNNAPSGPPPINLKFFGFASRQGEAKQIFLSQGDDIFVAGEGDIVKSRYKVLRISPNAVEIEDVLSNNRQSIPLSQS
ncbi:MAG TPA: hypothetical protein VN622_02085 [Clostridia bacterium]|nr:hypothetical protein [Clostridia bacterium]